MLVLRKTGTATGNTPCLLGGGSNIFKKKTCLDLDFQAANLVLKGLDRHLQACDLSVLLRADLSGVRPRGVVLLSLLPRRRICAYTGGESLDISGVGGRDERRKNSTQHTQHTQHTLAAR